MFEAGFLGTRAPLFMDLVTIYFGLLPFLVGYAIVLAVKGNYRAHFKTQATLFLITMVMVVIFEIGVRFDGGFNSYMQGSDLTYVWVLGYLIVHIIIALITVVAWGITIYKSMKVFVKEGPSSPYFSQHKAKAKWLYLAIVVTSVMGCSMYPILFIL
ncbi:DUF420 domain-containing protein [Sulfurimonas sp. HSL3-7]|uniref:DUF420 domain-containing protein n=1 Tax=Sulfonitrofixus jiaomeiensis TaxID=3131938 RepID=UPI0031F9D6B4